MSIEKFTIPVLTTSNYSAWAIQMEHILCVQSVWEVVSGDEKEPKKNDPKYAPLKSILKPISNPPLISFFPPSSNFPSIKTARSIKTRSTGQTLYSSPTCRKLSLKNIRSTRSLPSFGIHFKNVMLPGRRSAGFQLVATLPTRT